MAVRATAQERREWLDDLRTELPPGSTVYTVVRNVSRSGMSRAIDAYSITPAPDERSGSGIARHWLSYRIAAVLGWPFSERWEAVNVSGAGMDMGFHLVYSLSRRLYPDGFDCVGTGSGIRPPCPSNDHTNGLPRLDYGTLDWHLIDRPHHADGGYALRQEWL